MAIDDIDYARDWAGEARTDPEDGNTYILRSIEMLIAHLPERGFRVLVNDIMGGHMRYLDADEWVTWDRVMTDGN